MSGTTGGVVTRVVSRDGTEIAYRTTGEGPPLVLVHGVAGDHTRWHPLVPYLEPHVTVHAMERRGRGLSGDAPAYALEREFEDVAAVVDAVAEAAGGPVDLLGHSFGGLCAFGGAALTMNVGRLVLYEGWPSASGPAAPWSDLASRIDELLEAGDPERATETFFRAALGLPDEQFAAYRSQPSWPARVAAVPTLPRELRVDEPGLDPARAAAVTAPTLLLVGELSDERTQRDAAALAAALPDARLDVVPGQGHVGDVLAPEQFAAQLLAHLRPER